MAWPQSEKAGMPRVAGKGSLPYEFASAPRWGLPFAAADPYLPDTIPRAICEAWLVREQPSGRHVGGKGQVRFPRSGSEAAPIAGWRQASDSSKLPAEAIDVLESDHRPTPLAAEFATGWKRLAVLAPIT